MGLFSCFELAPGDRDLRKFPIVHPDETFSRPGNVRHQYIQDPSEFTRETLQSTDPELAQFLELTWEQTVTGKSAPFEFLDSHPWVTVLKGNEFQATHWRQTGSDASRADKICTWIRLRCPCNSAPSADQVRLFVWHAWSSCSRSSTATRRL